MNCKVHGQPESMACSRCGKGTCPMCAEYIDGSWFCSHCALSARRTPAGIEYQDLVAIGFGEPVTGEGPASPDIPGL